MSLCVCCVWVVCTIVHNEVAIATNTSDLQQQNTNEIEQH